MRSVVYQCAMSLDGYIAGPHGEFDWIVPDPDVDFVAMYARFDTFLMGRKTYEIVRRIEDLPYPAGSRTILCSRTAKPEEYPGVTITADVPRTIAKLKDTPGKDIWLFGGGELFRSLLPEGLVDRVEVAVVPVLLGGGIQLLPSPAARVKLRLTNHKASEKSGMVLLEYDVLKD